VTDILKETKETWGQWTWRGVFQARIPKSWRHREVDGLLEFVPTRPVGALHIRVLDRNRRGAVQPGEAADLVTNFAENQGVPLSSPVEISGGGTPTARASFTTWRDGAPLHWDVQAIVGRQQALVATYVHDNKHEIERKEALEIISSLVIEGTPREDTR
jgi:hypothetical protein